MIGSDPAENEDRRPYPFVLQSNTDDEPFDIDALDEFDPFEIDRQHAPLFKHHALGVDDIAGEVLTVPLAPSVHRGPTKCRPIGCYVAAKHVADRYWEDR